MQQEVKKPIPCIQYFAAITASLATFCSGTVFAWPAQISDDLLDGVLGFSINTEQLGWIASFSCFGSAILSLFIGPLCDAIGRKTTMLLLVIVFESGWLMIIFSNSFWLLTFGRFLTGMGAGCYCVTVSMYIGEIAEKNIRGTLGSLTHMSICLGVLFSTVLGAILPIRYYFVACGVMPIVFALAYFSMPESPVYFLLKEKTDKATDVLKRLLARDDVREELNELMTQSETKRVQLSIRDLLKKKSVRKSFVISLGLAILKSFSGIDAITSYLTHIFHKTQTPLDPKIATNIFALLLLLVLIPQTYLIDRAGRKILLLFSEFLMALCLGVTSLSLCLPVGSDAIKYLSLVALCGYTMAFSMGIGPIVWIVMAEVFEDKIRGRGISLCTFLIWILAFASIKLFVVLEDLTDLYLPIVIYGAVSLLGVFFVLFFVKETKGKSPQEIEEMLSE